MSLYQLYRNTTLGYTLQDALDELISSQQITPDLALKVLQQYDRTMSHHLGGKARCRYTFKGHLKVYRFCDNVWSFVIDNVEIKDNHSHEFIHTQKLKIVACEASSAKSA